METCFNGCLILYEYLSSSKTSYLFNDDSVAQTSQIFMTTVTYTKLEYTHIWRWRDAWYWYRVWRGLVVVYLNGYTGTRRTNRCRRRHGSLRHGSIIFTWKLRLTLLLLTERTLVIGFVAWIFFSSQRPDLFLGRPCLPHTSPDRTWNWWTRACRVTTFKKDWRETLCFGKRSSKRRTGEGPRWKVSSFLWLPHFQLFTEQFHHLA
jgi:hypothetical protein